MTAVSAESETSGITPHAHRLAVLDGYRALAAIAVVATHVGFQTGAAVRGPWAGWLARLDVGVAVFFLLSGFLLFAPHAAAHLNGSAGPQIRPYLWRRALRLLPAYWLALVGAAAIMPANQDRAPWDWVVQVLFLQIYVPDELLPGLTQTWSLATEVSFYVFLPVLGFVVARLGGRTPRYRLRRQLAVLALLGFAALVYRWAVFAWWQDDVGLALFWLPAYLDWFALGMAMASLRAFRGRTGSDLGVVGTLANSPGVCWVIAGCAYWLATTTIAGPFDLSAPTVTESFTRHLLYLAAAGFALLPAVLGSGAGVPLLSSRPALFLGRISYGIFLWNMVLLFVAFRILDLPYFSGGFLVVFALTLTLTVGIAAASWYAVERHALELRDVVRPRSQPQAPAGK